MDLVFAKAKLKGSRRITYRQFRGTALPLVAQVRVRSATARPAPTMLASSRCRLARPNNRLSARRTHTHTRARTNTHTDPPARSLHARSHAQCLDINAGVLARSIAGTRASTTRRLSMLPTSSSSSSASSSAAAAAAAAAAPAGVPQRRMSRFMLETQSSGKKRRASTNLGQMGGAPNL